MTKKDLYGANKLLHEQIYYLGTWILKNWDSVYIPMHIEEFVFLKITVDIFCGYDIIVFA